MKTIWDSGNKSTIKEIPLIFYFSIALLLILFLFSAMTGVLDYKITEQKMKEQVFPHAIAVHLTWINIGLQAASAAGLAYMFVTDRPMAYGLLLPIILLGIYTLYSLLAVTKAFGYTPCTCINPFGNTTWLGGTFINMAFLVISIISVSVFKRKGGVLSEIKH